jgi:hypothetical protein
METGVTVHGFDDTPVHNKWFKELEEKSKKVASKALPSAQLCLFIEGPAPCIPREKFVKHFNLLASKDMDIRLALPKGHGVSYAEIDTGSAHGFNRAKHFTGKGRSISSLMKEMNLNSMDVLKMDIESAEFGLFEAIVEDDTLNVPVARRLPTCQLLIEFHTRLSPLGDAAKVSSLEALYKLGFTLVHNIVREDTSDDAFFINSRFCLNEWSDAREELEWVWEASSTSFWNMPATVAVSLLIMVCVFVGFKFFKQTK